MAQFIKIDNVQYQIPEELWNFVQNFFRQFPERVVDPREVVTDYLLDHLLKYSNDLTMEILSKENVKLTVSGDYDYYKEVIATKDNVKMITVFAKGLTDSENFSIQEQEIFSPVEDRGFADESEIWLNFADEE